MDDPNDEAGPSNGSQASHLHQLAEDIRRRASEENEAAEAAKDDDPWTQNARDAMLEDIGIDLTGLEELVGDHDAGMEDGEDADADHMDLLRGINRISIEEVEVNGMLQKKFKFDDLDLEDLFDSADPYEVAEDKEMNAGITASPSYNGRDIISGICQHVELAVELGKHLNGKDILHLCMANRAFHNAVNGYLLSSIRAWIEHRAPEAGRIFHYQLYAKHLVDDPQKRTWMALKQGLTTSPKKDSKVRKVPGLKYLQLVLGRDKYCREILAIMARCGHRMPATMHHSLLRLWLLMDVSTSQQRQTMLRMTHLFKDADLYNMQMFFIKLGMLFNDPVFGPSKFDLVQLMLGQQGLYKLWQLLTRKKFYKLADILELKLRYDFSFFNEGSYWLENALGQIQGIPFHEIGQQHKEGWGAGRMHLLRPDEAVPIEAVRRGLQLDDHLTHMVLWGYFDWKTGENIVPSMEEMYIEDEDEVLANVDTLEHWKPRHVLKKRWHELTPEQQDEILSDEEDERLRAQAWCGHTEEEDDIEGEESAGGLYDPYESDFDDLTLDLDEEIDRGYIVPPQPKDHKSTVPDVDNLQGWMDFVNQSVLGGMVPDLGEEEKARAQAWCSYPDKVMEGSRAWEELVREARNRHQQHQQQGWEEEEDGDLEDEEDLDEEDDQGDVEDEVDMEGNEDVEDEEDGNLEMEEEEEEDGGNLETVYQANMPQYQPVPVPLGLYYYNPFAVANAFANQHADDEMDIDPPSPRLAASSALYSEGADGFDEAGYDYYDGDNVGYNWDEE